MSLVNYVWIFSWFLLGSCLDVLVLLGPNSYHLQNYIPQVSNDLEADDSISIEIKIHTDLIAIGARYYDIENLIGIYNVKCIMDLTNDTNLSYTISEVASKFQIVHIVLEKDQILSSSEWTLPGRVTVTDEAQAAWSLIKHLSWMHTVIAVQPSISGIEFSKFWENLPGLEIPQQLFISSGEVAVDNQVGRMIKPTGVRFSVIYGDEESTILFLKSVEEKRIGSEGFGHLSVGTAFVYLQALTVEEKENTGLLSTGMLFIIEEGFHNAKDINEILIAALIQNCKRLAAAQQDLNFSSQLSLRQKLIEKYYNPSTIQLLPFFTICNAVAGSLIVVGSIDQPSVKLIDDIVFPGNTNETPIDLPVDIWYSFLGADLKDADQSENHNSLYQQLGSFIAFDEIALSEVVLPTFNLKYHEINIGTWFFVESYARAKFFKQAPDFGVAFSGLMDSDMVFGILAFEQELGISLPKLFGMPAHSYFSNPQIVPMFNRTGSSSIEYVQFFIRMLKYFHWEDVVWLIHAQADFVDFKNLFTDYGQNQGVRIANKLNTLPKYTECVLPVEYEALLDEIMNSNCRPLILLQIGLWLECSAYIYWYDQGLRETDLYPIDFAGTQIFTMKSRSPEEYEKVKGFHKGLLGFTQESFIGDVGEVYIDKFIQIYGASPQVFSCIQYDSLWQLGYALDLAVSRGFDYEDPVTLNDILRSTRFTGCTGNVSLDKSSNDRTYSGFAIFQNAYDEENDEFTRMRIGSYNPLSITWFISGRGYQRF